jgi:hypothetical protein
MFSTYISVTKKSNILKCRWGKPFFVLKHTHKLVICCDWWRGLGGEGECCEVLFVEATEKVSTFIVSGLAQSTGSEGEGWYSVF